MSSAESIPAAVVQVLVDNHRRFVSFVERRVASRSIAEEIVQEALVKGIEKAGSIRDDERAVAWFYRLLRNAVVDHHRRRASEQRALAGHARELEVAGDGEDAELEATVCRCVVELATTLKPEYASILRRVELEDVPVTRAAAEVGITANNASVRLHRAREALRRQVKLACGICAEHGCLDCDCRSG